MRVSTIRSVPCRNFSKNPVFVHHFSVSAILLSSIFDDSCSDKNKLRNHSSSSSSSCSSGGDVVEFDFVGLNTNKVVGTLKNLRRDPRNAFSYFMDAKKHGFRHCVKTHFSIIRILCSCGSNRLLQDLLLGVIKSSDDELGFDVSELLDAIVDRLEVEGTSSLVRVFDALIKTYVHLGMFDESIDLLFQTRRRGFLPCLFTCNYLINCLIGHGQWDMAIAIYQHLERLGLEPNVYTYNLMIKAFCRKGCLEKALNILMAMEDAGVDPNEYSFTAYIEGLCSVRNSELAYNMIKAWKNSVPFAYDVVVRGFCNEMKMNEAEGVLLDMKNQGLTPSVRCYSTLIRAYCKCGNLAKARFLQNDMRSKGLKVNCFIVSDILHGISSMGSFTEVVSEIQTYKEWGVFLDEVCYNIWLDALCKMGKVEEAVGVLEELKRLNMVPDIIHYSSLINGYCLQGRLVDAWNLFEQMKNKGFEADLITYAVLAGGFARNGFVKETFGILDYMRSRGLEPDVAMNNKIIESLCAAGKVQEADMFFKSLKEKHVDNYSGIIKGYCYANHTLEAFELFDKTFHLGVVQKKTCMMLLNSLLTEGETQKGFMVFKTFLTSEDNRCVIVTSKLIGALCNVGELEKARWVFDNWIKRGMVPDAIMYTIMMNGYCRGNLILEAFELFHDMKHRGITPDVITYTVLLCGHLQTSLKNSSSSSNLSVEEKASMIESTQSRIRKEMVEMNVKPDVVFYTVLIEGKSKLNSVQDALTLFNEMIESGLQPDTVAYSSFWSF